MRFAFLSYLLLFLLIPFNNALASSVFHSYVSDLNPPYVCKLKLKKARGVSLATNHRYQFSGICSIKLPIGSKWIYQNVWVDLFAEWNGETNEGYETTIFYNNVGSVIAQLKCDDDPWLTKAQCALVGYQNNTQFTNLGGVYNQRNGQYPPFEISTGQYPPLARNQAILQDAISLSLLTAREEASAAHTAFNQTFANQTAIPPIVTSTPVSKPVVRKKITRVYKKPKIGNMRLDCCLKLNKDCGKPAADEFCRSQGHKRAVNCKVDNDKCLPTFIIGTKTICNQPFCKGFIEIECE